MDSGLRHTQNNPPMKSSKLALGLSITAGLICLSNFAYKLIKFDRTDYMILLAGIFIIAFGVSNYNKKRS
jgi:hypothetical protein